METSDPDDVLALALLADHPAVDLLAVTINPGTFAQISVVAEVLSRVGSKPLPIGARNPKSDKVAVSAFHDEWLGSLPPRQPDAVASDLLIETFGAYPSAVLLTGAPLHNLRLALRANPTFAIQRWVTQGGFAGDNLVRPEDRLEKFAGKPTCESHNFGVDAKGTMLAITSPQIVRRELVSKNVTHGFAWDAAFHGEVKPYCTQRAGIAVAHDAMSRYLELYGTGKLLHDPLAAIAIYNPEVFEWAEVEVYKEQGRWGARAANDTSTFITTALHRERVLSALVGSHD